MLGIGGDIGEQAIRQLGRAEKYLDGAAKATGALAFPERRSSTLIGLGTRAMERAEPMFVKYGEPADADRIADLIGTARTHADVSSMNYSQEAGGYTHKYRLKADADSLRKLADEVHDVRDRAIELRSAGLTDARAAAVATARDAVPDGEAARLAALRTLDEVDVLVTRAASARSAGAAGAIPTVLASGSERLRKLADLPGVPEKLRGDIDGLADLVDGVSSVTTSDSELQTIVTRMAGLRAGLEHAALDPSAVAAAGVGDARLAVDLPSVLRRTSSGTNSLLDALEKVTDPGTRSRVVKAARQRLEVVRSAWSETLGGQAAWRIDDAIDEPRRLEVTFDPTANLKDPALASARSTVRAALDGIDAVPTDAASISADDVVKRFAGHLEIVTDNARGSLASAVKDRGSLIPAGARAGIANQAVDRALRDLLGLTGDVAGAEARNGVRDAAAGLAELGRLPIADIKQSRTLANGIDALAITADEVARGVATDDAILARLAELNAYEGTVSIVKPTKVGAEWAVLRNAREPLDRALQETWDSSGFMWGDKDKAKVALTTLDDALTRLHDASKTIRADGAKDAADIADEGLAILDGQREQLLKYTKHPNESNLIKHAQFGVANSYLDLAEAVADEFYATRRAAPASI